MRRTLNIGIGLGTAAIVATMAAGVASATTGGHQQAAGPARGVVRQPAYHPGAGAADRQGQGAAQPGHRDPVR